MNQDCGIIVGGKRLQAGQSDLPIWQFQMAITCARTAILSRCASVLPQALIKGISGMVYFRKARI